MDAGADIEEQDKGATPLFLAVRDGHLKAAELLIALGQRERRVGYWPTAYRCGPEEFVRSYAAVIGARCRS